MSRINPNYHARLDTRTSAFSSTENPEFSDILRNCQCFQSSLCATQPNSVPGNLAHSQAHRGVTYLLIRKNYSVYPIRQIHFWQIWNFQIQDESADGRLTSCQNCFFTCVKTLDTVVEFDNATVCAISRLLTASEAYMASTIIGLLPHLPKYRQLKAW